MQIHLSNKYSELKSQSSQQGGGTNYAEEMKKLAGQNISLGEKYTHRAELQVIKKAEAGGSL